MYKFNGGAGAVICDKCRVMIDEGLGPDEYEKAYGKGEVLCWRCKPGTSRKRRAKAD